MTPLLLTVALLRGADVTLTLDLSQRYGGHEANPLMPASPAAVAVVESAATVAQVWALHRLEKKHPRLVRTVTWVSIGLTGAAVWHNAREYH